jgi:hypothetical protein
MTYSHFVPFHRSIRRHYSYRGATVTENIAITGWDRIALPAAIAALAACGFVAAIIPALRAASIDPMSAPGTETVAGTLSERNCTHFLYYRKLLVRSGLRIWR